MSVYNQSISSYISKSSFHGSNLTNLTGFVGNVENVHKTLIIPKSLWPKPALTSPVYVLHINWEATLTRTTADSCSSQVIIRMTDSDLSDEIVSIQLDQSIFISGFVNTGSATCHYAKHYDVPDDITIKFITKSLPIAAGYQITAKESRFDVELMCLESDKVRDFDEDY